MSITINLPADTEQKLREAAVRRGQTLEAYLEWLATVSAVANGSGPPERTPDEKVAAWREWVASHASNPHVADDSRESMYGDRGE
jgi:hypothetical protein